MKIAVIGSGISGIVSTYILQRDHEITLFEANDYLGGHTSTIDLVKDNRNYAIDTGFIVFNNRTYPNFIKFLNELNVEWQNTQMSFSVSDLNSDFEYNGHNLDSIFAQRKNLFKLKFFKFLYEIIRFNRLCHNYNNKDEKSTELTLGKFLDINNFSDRFKEYYIYPMCSAIWSSSYKEVEDFSLDFFLRFFINHGLVNVFDRPQWHVVKNGSREYVKAFIEKSNADIKLNTKVLSVSRGREFVDIIAEKNSYRFDAVVFACHSDQALALLCDPTDDELNILSKIQYQKNEVILHFDSTVLPQNKKAWASWNYKIMPKDQRITGKTSVSYNMNILQNIKSETNFIVSLNQTEFIDQEKIIKKFIYSHPVFNTEAELAKKHKNKICGKNNSYYCGAYWYNGFHEDGVKSALDVTSKFGLNL